jgi:linoleate 9S-lipoxygenase
LGLYSKFVEEVKGIEKIIDERNKDPARKMRSVPYEFLSPTSGPGITYRGVPQSVSI